MPRPSTRPWSPASAPTVERPRWSRAKALYAANTAAPSSSYLRLNAYVQPYKPKLTLLSHSPHPSHPFAQPVRAPVGPAGAAAARGPPGGLAAERFRTDQALPHGPL